jgi:hypothetical protein
MAIKKAVVKVKAPAPKGKEVKAGKAKCKPCK